MSFVPDNPGSESSPLLIPEAAEDVHRLMCDIPDRQIIDFLVQFFLVHVPWLMGKYQDWCKTLSAEECAADDTLRQLRVTDVDFVVLLLRIVSYALQFLPSPIYPLDKIRGVLLADVRNECDEIANTLEAISWALDGRGSLIRVHQLAYVALKSQTEGNINACPEIVSRAIRIAQSIGIHSDSVTAAGTDDTEKEMARRTFCNLYTWDSLLSRQLDRMPALHGRLHPSNWPQLHTLSEYRHREETSRTPLDPCLEAPDPFTERFLQARLADFWRSVNPLQGNEDDIMAAEERYNKFSWEFLSQLPPAFALADPDESWDKLLPKLPLQRQLLHIAIYDSLCWNFRPLLFQDPSSSLSLPPYKALLLSSQKRGVAGAALRSLEGVARLHALLGGCHTRLAGIVISTFEAAVLLLRLWADPSFLEDDNCLEMYQRQQRQQLVAAAPRVDPIRANVHIVNRPACMEAVEGAVKRLKMLSEVSSIADIGASTLVELLKKMKTTSEKGSGGMTGNTELEKDASTAKGLAMMTVDTSTIHVATQDHGRLHHGQGQEAEGGSLHNSPRTTTSSLTGEPVVNEATMVMTWNTASCDSIDVMDIPSLQDMDFISISATMAVGDMANWSAFYKSNMFSPDSGVAKPSLTTSPPSAPALASSSAISLPMMPLWPGTQRTSTRLGP
ncbi:hypothetical protein B0T09DRAFT_354025 [Sordaria sp. MPI-SDFR-AT-0083]|nr:hypothetical protein B0T09DRAFT_354025 [Sordaria sp. MPI-SDFR-AT-0083]